MKAIVYKKYGSPDVLQLEEVDIPHHLEPKDMLIKVKATTVNRTDCANLSAKPFIMRFVLGFWKPKIQIGGTEFAGVVEKSGEAVSEFKPGDNVFGFNDTIVSSHAEYLIISESNGVALMPDISFEQAAASTEGAHYAINTLNKVELKAGDKVLVNGASGGIGSAAVQLLKYYGTEITAVTESKNLELVRSLGASEVIDFKKEDFTKSEDKFDYIFDCVGKSTFGKCKHLLHPGGTYISSELGPMAQNAFLFMLTSLFGKVPGQSGKRVGFPYPENVKRSVEMVRKLTIEGHFKPVIDRSYTLEQLPDAFEYVCQGLKTGNVVINIE